MERDNPGKGVKSKIFDGVFILFLGCACTAVYQSAGLSKLEVTLSGLNWILFLLHGIPFTLLALQAHFLVGGTKLIGNVIKVFSIVVGLLPLYLDAYDYVFSFRSLLILLVILYFFNKSRYKCFFNRDFLSIALLFSTNLLIFRAISPLYDGSIFDLMGGRLDSLQPLVSTFLNNTVEGEWATSFNQKTAFGGMVLYPFSQSPLLQIYMILRFGVDPTGYLHLFEGFREFYFICINLCCVGVYFLTRNGFNFSRLSAFIAALLYIYGNLSFLGYLGNENYHQWSEYIVFPYVLLAVIRGIRLGSIPLVLLSGFLLGTANLIMSSAYEFRFLAVTFAVIAVILISRLFHTIRYRKIISTIFVFGIGYLGGSIIDIVVTFGNIFTGNLSIQQPHLFNGFPWRYPLVSWPALFNQYLPALMYPNPPNDVGRHVGFFTGSVGSVVILYYIIKLVFQSTANRYKEGNRKELYFAIVLFLLLLTAQLAELSPISLLMNLVEVGRIHFPSRYLCFLTPFLLFTTVYFFERELKGHALRKNVLLSSCAVLIVWSSSLQFLYGSLSHHNLFLIIVGSLIAVPFIENIKRQLIFCFALVVSIVSVHLDQSDIVFGATGRDKLQISEYSRTGVANEELIKLCDNNIDNIDRFSLNPICQDMNSELLREFNKTNARYLYLTKKGLPQLISFGHHFDVASAAIYSFSGSPIFPNALAREWLESIFGMRPDQLAINSYFSLDKLGLTEFVKLLKNFSIEFIVLETDMMDEVYIKNLLRNLTPIFANDKFIILENANAKPIVSLQGLTLRPESLAKRVISAEHEATGSVGIKNITGSKASLDVSCSSQCIISVNNVFLPGYVAYSGNTMFDVSKAEDGSIEVFIPDMFSGTVVVQFLDIFRWLSGVLFLLLLNLLTYRLGFSRKSGELSPRIGLEQDQVHR